jgi:hypothetical protein
VQFLFTTRSRISDVLVGQNHFLIENTLPPGLSRRGDNCQAKSLPGDKHFINIQQGNKQLAGDKRSAITGFGRNTTWSRRDHRDGFQRSFQDRIWENSNVPEEFVCARPSANVLNSFGIKKCVTS